MSQHWFEVKSNEGIVEVMLGWDAPLQWYHMCIDFSILNRPGFPGECFICELRLPDHRFRWKH
ncbi:hypothetical protein C9185_26820, partial (plasmid) [Escherichia coli]